MTRLEGFHAEPSDWRSFRDGFLIGDAPSVDPPPVSASWLGMHVTDGELSVWRDRAVNGPFRVAGDFSANSPGDWSRIVAQKDSFLANPSRDMYTSGTIAGWNNDFKELARYMRSAAFFHLVRHPSESTGTVATAVRDRLVNQAGMVDFTNRTEWPLEQLYDRPPSWQVCEWLFNHIHAYDYIRAYERETGQTVFSSAQRQQLLTWFYHAADYWQHDSNKSHDNLLGTGRWNDPPTYKTLTWGTTHIGFHNGSQTFTHPNVVRFFNNRKAHLFAFPAVAGVYLQTEGFTPPAGASPGLSLDMLRKQGRLWIEEDLKFATSAFPSYFGDSNRWTSSLPNLGWSYWTASVGRAHEIADIEARLGNPSIYKYGTTYGQVGSATTFAKTLKYVLQDFQKYVREEHNLFGSNDLSNNTFFYKITTRGGNRERIRDVGLTLSSLWYQDDLIDSTLNRSASGAPGFPVSAEGAGLGFGPEGANVELPGALFMFAGTGADPYPER